VIRGRRGAGAAGALAVWILTATSPLPAQELEQVTDLRERAAAARAADDLPAAAEGYLELVRREPGELRWVLDATDCLLQLGRFEEALDLLEDRRARFPGDPEIQTRIARTYQMNAEDMVTRGVRDLNVRFQLAEAARIADEVLRRHPAQREARLILALSSLRLGRKEAALAEAEELIRRFPGDQAGFVIAGDINYSEFVEQRERLRTEQLSPAERDALVELNTAVKARATAAYGRAADLGEGRPHPHVQLGNIYGWSSELERALREYTVALSFDPHCAVNHSWLSGQITLAQRIDFYRAASAAYRERGAPEPAAAAILDWYLAYALYEKKDYSGAYELFASAVEGNPAYLNSHCYAMLAAYWDGDRRAAETQATTYATKASTHFADTVRGTANKDEIISILEFLVQQSHDNQRLANCLAISHVLAKLLDTDRHWNNYAFLCRQSGRFEESLSAYQNALSIAPNSPQLLNDTAVILHYHLPTDDNLELARSYYERAIIEADRVQQDEAATNDAKATARQARIDASNNLAKLPK